MPRKRVFDGSPNFSGGVNTVDDPLTLQSNELQSAFNVYYNKGGEIITRTGTQRMSSAADPTGTLLGVGAWLASGSYPELVVLSTSAGVNTLYTAGATPPATYTSRGNVLPGADSYINFETFIDAAGKRALYMAGIASGGPCTTYSKWVPNTPAVADITPTVSIGLIKAFNQRLFGITLDTVNTTTSQTLYYSALNNGDTIGNAGAGGGQVNLSAYSSGGIVDLLPVGSSLFILMQNGIARYTGWSNDDISIANNITQASAVGVPQPYTSVSLGNIGYFVSDNGYVYSIDEAGTMQIINLQFPVPASSWQGVVLDRAATTIIWFGQAGQYYYNYVTNSWSGGSYPNVTSARLPGFTGGSSSAPTLMYYIGTNGYIYRVSGVKDDVLVDGSGGSAISASIKTKRYTFKSPHVDKAFRFVYINRNNLIQGTCSVSLNGTTLTTSGATSDNPIRYQGLGTGRYAELIITDTDSIIGDIFSSCFIEAFEYAPRYA